MPRQRSRSHSRPQEESMARRVDGTSLLNPETKFSMDRNAISSAPGSLKGRESKGLRTRSRDRLNSVTSTLAATRDKVSQVRRFSMTSSRAASAASKPAHAVQRASLPVGVLEKLASLPLYLGDTQSCSLEQLYQATLDVLRCTGNNQLTSNGLFYVKECFRRADEQEEWSSDSRIEDFIPISLAVIKAKDIGPLLVKHPASRAGTAIKSQLFWRALVRPSQSQPSSSTSSSSTSSSFRAVREKQKLEEQISATHLYSHLMVDCEDSPEWDGSRVQLNVSNLLNEDLVLQIWRADDMKAGSEDSDVAMAATLGVEKTSSSRSRSSSLHKPRNVSELSSTKTSGGQNFRQRIRTLSSKSRLSRPVESLQKKTVTSLITEAILPLEGIQGRFHEVDKWLVATRTEGKDGKDGKATQASLPQIRMKARVLTDKAIPEVPGVSAVEVYLFTLETFLFHERHLALYQSQLSAAAAATAAGTSSQRASSHSVEGGGSGGSGTHTTSSSSSSNAGGMPVITSAELSETARYILQQVAALRGVTLKEEIWCQWLAGSKTLSTSGDIVLTSDGAQQTLYAARLLKENSQLVQSLPEAEVQAWKDSLESVAEGLLKHARHLAYKIILESGLDDWNSLLQCTKCIRAITELLLYRAWFPSMANCKTRVVGAVKEVTKEWYLTSIDIARNDKTDFQSLVMLTSNMAHVLDVCGKLAASLEDQLQTTVKGLQDKEGRDSRVTAESRPMDQVSLGISFRSIVKRNLLKWSSADTPAIVTLCTKFCLQKTSSEAQKLALMTSLRKMFSTCGRVWPQRVLRHLQISDGAYCQWFEALFIRWHTDFENQCKDRAAAVLTAHKANNIQELTIKGSSPLLCTQSAQELAFVIELLLNDYKQLLSHPVIEHAFSSAECIINTVYLITRTALNEHWLQQLTAELDTSHGRQTSIETIAALLNNTYYMVHSIIKRLQSLLELDKLSDAAFRARLESDGHQFPDVQAVFSRMIDSTSRSLFILASSGLNQLAVSVVTEDALPYLKKVMVGEGQAEVVLRTMVSELSLLFSNMQRVLHETYMPKLVSNVWRSLVLATKKLVNNCDSESIVPSTCLMAFGRENHIYDFFDDWLKDKTSLDSPQYKELISELEERQCSNPVEAVLSYSHETNSIASGEACSSSDASIGEDWGNLTVQAGWLCPNGVANTEANLAVKLCNVTGLQAVTSASWMDKLLGLASSSAASAASSRSDCFFITATLSPEVLFENNGIDVHAQQRSTLPFNGSSAILDRIITFTMPAKLASLSGVGVMIRVFQHQSMAFRNPFVGQAFLETVSVMEKPVKLSELNQMCMMQRLRLHMPVTAPMSQPHWQKTFSRLSKDQVVSKFVSGEQAWVSRARHSRDKLRSSMQSNSVSSTQPNSVSSMDE